jgi:putative ABC transport system ATP-binding protein
MSEPIISLKEISKSYDHGRTRALRDVSLAIPPAQFVAIIGPSGSGKSTLLNLIGALDRPDAGQLRVAQTDLCHTRDLSGFRARCVGFVFQLHNLIPSLTAVENVEVPMFELRLSRHERRRRAIELLVQVGLGKNEMRRRPTDLSGGERQRVAVARALANQPSIILADEPTGNLDSENEAKVLALLQQINQSQHVTLILVTHAAEVARAAERTVQLRDGVIVADNPQARVLS